MNAAKKEGQWPDWVAACMFLAIVTYLCLWLTGALPLLLEPSLAQTATLFFVLIGSPFWGGLCWLKLDEMEENNHNLVPMPMRLLIIAVTALLTYPLQFLLVHCLTVAAEQFVLIYLESGWMPLHTIH